MFGFFLHTLLCFLSPLCNFYVISDWLHYKQFPTKNSASSAACQILNYVGKGNFKGRFLKLTLPEKLLTVLYTKWSYLKK